MKSGPFIAVVDFGMGNLFSVVQACREAGLEARVTREAEDLRAAAGVVLPGVGAFGRAMESLASTGLDDSLRRCVVEGKPLLGVCLGLQLLFDESEEFGRQRGLGILPGRVVRLQPGVAPDSVKVPHVGWNRLLPQKSGLGPMGQWHDAVVADLRDSDYMYFVHSYIAQPAEMECVSTQTDYGPNRFSSSVRRGSVFACQFHPERSGPAGLRIYRRLAEHVLGVEAGASRGAP